MLNAEILAITASICFAASEVTMKRGLASVTVIGSLVITLGAALVVLAIAALFDPPPFFDARAMVLFAAGGLAAPGIARWGATHGVDRLGPSIAVPIAQGARPLLAIAGAVLLFGEPLEAHRALGLGAILAGGWQLSRRRASPSLEPSNLPKRWRDLIQPGIAFPLIAGASYAIQDLLAKRGLAFMPFPAFGAMLGVICGLSAWGVAIAASPRLRGRISFGGHKRWLMLSGALSGLALATLFKALERGDISLVSPIIATQPLAVLLLSHTFLRGMEHLGIQTVMAACSVVFGTVIVTL